MPKLLAQNVLRKSTNEKPAKKKTKSTGIATLIGEITPIDRELMIVTAIFALSFIFFPFGPALVIGIYIGMVKTNKEKEYNDIRKKKLIAAEKQRKTEMKIMETEKVKNFEIVGQVKAFRDAPEERKCACCENGRHIYGIRIDVPVLKDKQGIFYSSVEDYLGDWLHANRASLDGKKVRIVAEVIQE
jgi:hypothetical protein